MKRRLTPEEEELWQYVTRNDAPLHANARPPEPDMGGHEPETRAAPRKPSAKIKKWQPSMHASLPAVRASDAPLTLGDTAGIDRANAQRFRKGKYPIDATLDLHGLSREKAYDALLRFISRHYAAQARCLLIITGKGKDSPNTPGVLREEVPRWLAQPELKAQILALSTAQAKHGGGGAYYLLLRRKRT